MQYDNIGNFIKTKRTLLGKTLNKFAIDNDIEPAILSRIENNKQDIKLKVLIKISKGFNQSLSEFISEFEKTN